MKLFSKKSFFIFSTFFLFVSTDARAQSMGKAVRQNLRYRLEEGNMLGISVAYIHSNGNTTYFSKGFFSSKKIRAVDKHTIFEIGSITKTFTSLILARMARQHIVNLDDPISKFLPDSVRAPSKNSRQMTLRQLAMHTSGLPRLPSNLHPSDWLDPYAKYTVHDLYQFLDHYTPSQKPGSSFQYSNLGAGLLGVLLERAAHQSYAKLLNRYVTGPLHMKNTNLELPSKENDRFAEPYNFGQAVKHWTFSGLAGAGAIRSTAKDLATYVKAQMGLTQTIIKPAIDKTHQMQFHIGSGNEDDIGLAWIQSTKHDTIIWHNGGTGGFHSFIGWNKEKHTGVVILENGKDNIDDVGFHLLDPRNKLRLQLADSILRRYTGTYQLRPKFSITIIKRGGQLFEQATNQQALPIYPKSRRKFYLNAVDAQIEFIKTKRGKITNMKLFQGGRVLTGDKTN